MVRSVDEPKSLKEIITAGEAITLKRSQIRGAPYNPRKLSDAAKAKLGKGLRKHGLISWITWNKRTGTIVGGHQRIKILDDLAGGEDYELKVISVDLSEGAEREANILLNNETAQGEFDIEKLTEMLRDSSVEVDGTGYDMADVYRIFGDDPLTARSESELDELAGHIREARDRHDSIVKNIKNRDGVDWYTVVVFRDDADRDAFHAALGMDQNRFQDGRLLRKLLKPEWQEPGSGPPVEPEKP